MDKEFVLSYNKEGPKKVREKNYESRNLYQTIGSSRKKTYCCGQSVSCILPHVRNFNVFLSSAARFRNVFNSLRMLTTMPKRL
jgi:hypothetical protein